EDAPVHLQRRQRLLRPLSGPPVLAWEPGVRELVTGHLDGLVRDGKADLVQRLLWDVPALVVYAFLGVPEDDVAEAMRYAVGLSLFTWGRPTDEEQVAATDALGRYWKLTGRLLERCRRDGRAEGWIGHALRAQQRSRELFDDRYVRAL